MFGFFRKKPIHPPIYLYNSLTREKEPFASIKSGSVLMYACGPTVYDHIHIGNLRAYLLPDLLHRLFLACGYRVKLTINVTDFGHLSDDGDSGEDKMMKGMRREGLAISLENMRQFAEPYIQSFQKDLEYFNNLPPTNLTRASDYVTEQIALIETLTQKGYTYETSDGVYFDISKFPRYGKLGSINLAEIRAGARVEENLEKRHPADFALWKKGDLGWKSRFGLGFPGWHIECTAMIFSTLGKQIDIHTGGEDLMYTHHNGEIAQAESITNRQFVRYWMHNAFITVDDEKFSKSLGNGIRLSDLIEKGFKATEYRYWLLQSHYRTLTNFSFDALTSAQIALRKLKRFVYEELGDITPVTPDATYDARFLKAMSDDLDTPKAIAILWELVKDTQVPSAAKLATIQQFDAFLGLGLSKTAAEGRKELGMLDETDIPLDIRDLLTERDEARQKKDWARADALRNEIQSRGYIIDDLGNRQKITRK